MTQGKWNDWFGLEGTACVLAGANGLLGRACARALSDCGARVIGLDLEPSSGPWGQTQKVDITDPKQLDAFFGSLKASANPSTRHWVFVNGSYPRTANWGTLGFENIRAEDWKANVDLHLGSAFAFAQRAVEFLKATEGGSIVHFGSIYGLQGPDLRIYEGTPMKNPAPYAAIKAGIIGLSRYIATVFGEQGIRSNVVCPGGIEDRQPASFKEAYEARTPLGRMGKAEDIAGAVAFLAGPSARYITGQSLVVDGGWTAW